MGRTGVEEKMMDSELIKEFIEPSLLILIPVMYLIGGIIKQTQFIDDKFIPLINTLFSIILCVMYVFTKNSHCIEGFFVAITQGILIAGASVYANQIVKQVKK